MESWTDGAKRSMAEWGKGEKCCGCGACAQGCPQKCITLKEDQEGFLYPQIDEAACVECNLCKRSCPLIGADRSENTASVRQTLMVYAKDTELRVNSSSGGVFGLLAKKILENNGVVFGAAFDVNMMVHHIAVDKEENLFLLQGSKYLQSRVENTYVEAKNALKFGKEVLYSGTACQIAGLKAYLKRDYENLYTIDVLCHGVPSPKVWKKYLNWQEKLHGAAVSLEFSNETAYKQIFTKDLFMQLFLKNICLRPSCHSCQFKTLERPSDITLGDCWGIEQHTPEMDDDKGVSVVLTHTEKGNALFRKIQSDVEWRSGEVDRLLPPYADSRKSVEAHKNRDLFFKMVNRGVPFGFLGITLLEGKREKLKYLIKWALNR